jgi:alpha-glucosidase (family GH31 glycosyl hydrolase)
MKADNGSEYEGYVWCGKTVWPDWTHPCTDDWWRDCLATFKKTVDFDGIWLDMNEPANLPVATDKWLSTKSVLNIGGRVLVDLGQNLWDYPPYAVSALPTFTGPAHDLQIHSGWKALGDLTMSPSATTEDGRRHYHQHNLYPIQYVTLVSISPS